MTDKRDSKRKPKKDERPEVEKEKPKDLPARQQEGEDVRGGGKVKTPKPDLSGILISSTSTGGSGGED